MKNKPADDWKRLEHGCRVAPQDVYANSISILYLEKNGGKTKKQRENIEKERRMDGKPIWVSQGLFEPKPIHLVTVSNHKL